MKKIEREDILSISKVVNNDLDLEFKIELKGRMFGTNTITFSAEAFIKMKNIIEEILKQDAYSGQAQDRMVEKFLKTPMPGEDEVMKK